MQKERTLAYWDNFYGSTTTTRKKEWILQPSPALLEQLAEHIPRNRPSLRILEIGCGSSSLARDLWLHLIKTRRKKEDARLTIHVWATDVSHMCIQQNQERDADTLTTATVSGSFEYGVLNVVEKHPELEGKFDVILDKGCLDTFMFRSKNRGGRKSYSPLLRGVLDNIHCWLCNGTATNGGDSKNVGIYLIISPRSKLKGARDYKGFCEYQRHRLDSTDLNRGELVEAQDDKPTFLHVCRKNPHYSLSCTDAFCIEKKRISDEDTCRACRLMFLEFRKGEGLLGRGEIFWFREWSSHCQHCKG